MAAKTFDKETILDLTVNLIPLGIILFFVLLFGLTDSFGFDLLPSVIGYGLLVVPFVGLAVLTYLSGKAIAGGEKEGVVYGQGQAGVPDATPLEHGHEDDSSAIDEADEGPSPEGELEESPTDAESTDADSDTSDAESTDEGATAE